MPRNKKSNDITTNQFLTSLTNLGIDVTQFTPDAIEILRICHKEFIALLSSELDHRQVSKSTTQTVNIVQESDVEVCMRDLHFDSLLENVKHEINISNKKISHSNPNPSTSRKAGSKRRKKNISDDAFEEQERMLAQSAETCASIPGSQVIIGVQDSLEHDKSDSLKMVNVGSLLKEQK